MIFNVFRLEIQKRTLGGIWWFSRKLTFRFFIWLPPRKRGVSAAGTDAAPHNNLEKASRLLPLGSLAGGAKPSRRAAFGPPRARLGNGDTATTRRPA